MNRDAQKGGEKPTHDDALEAQIARLREAERVWRCGFEYESGETGERWLALPMLTLTRIWFAREG